MEIFVEQAHDRLLLQILLVPGELAFQGGRSDEVLLFLGQDRRGILQGGQQGLCVQLMLEQVINGPAFMLWRR